MTEVRREARVFNHGEFAGELRELVAGGFVFEYVSEYLANPSATAISLTLPLRRDAYRSDVLFPFFFGLLAEGSTRELQARQLRIDESDEFALLVATGRDLVGAVTVEPR